MPCNLALEFTCRFSLRCYVQNMNDGGYSMYAGGAIPRYHFDTFLDSLLSLFIIMTSKQFAYAQYLL